MIGIQISEKVYEPIDMVELLCEIADLIEDGYTSGLEPSWYLVETIEENKEQHGNNDKSGRTKTTRATII